MTGGTTEEYLGSVEHYRLLKVLGAGGMGRVYLAEDTLAGGRKVAIKTIEIGKHMPGPQREHLKARLRQEASALGRVTHHCIPVLYHALERKDEFFLVMEYVEGRSLSELARDSVALTQRRVVEIALDVLTALGAAHEQGLLHRDLKPSNVMVTPSGEVKVIDFGLAKDLAMEGDVTGSGSTPGTPGYMAPEQLLGKKLTAATDLFSLGVILYELLTGEGPFQGKTTTEMAFSTLREPPRDIVLLNPGVPAPLCCAVMTALAKEPSERFKDASEMAQALRLALGQTIDVTIPRHSVRQKRRGISKAALIAAAGLVSIMAAGGYLLYTGVLQRRSEASGQTPVAPGLEGARKRFADERRKPEVALAEKYRAATLKEIDAAANSREPAVVKAAADRLSALVAAALEDDSRAREAKARYDAARSVIDAGRSDILFPGRLREIDGKASSAVFSEDYEAILSQARKLESDIAALVAGGRAEYEKERDALQAARRDGPGLSEEDNAALDRITFEAEALAAQGAFPEAAAVLRRGRALFEQLMGRMQLAAAVRRAQVEYAGLRRDVLTLHGELVAAAADATAQAAELYASQGDMAAAVEKYEEATRLLQDAADEAARAKAIEQMKGEYASLRRSQDGVLVQTFCATPLAELDALMESEATSDRCAKILADFKALIEKAGQEKSAADQARARFDAALRQGEASVARVLPGELDALKRGSQAAVTESQWLESLKSFDALLARARERMKSDPVESAKMRVLENAEASRFADAVNGLCGELLTQWSADRRNGWSEFLEFVRGAREQYPGLSTQGRIRLDDLESKILEFAAQEAQWTALRAEVASETNAEEKRKMLDSYMRGRPDSIYRRDAERLYEEIRDEMRRDGRLVD